VLRHHRHEHERRGGRRLAVSGQRSVPSDDHEPSFLDEAAELVLPVDAQLVGSRLIGSAAVLETLLLVHDAAETVEAPVEAQRAAARQRPLLMLHQRDAERIAVKRLDHEPAAGSEHAPELAQGDPVAAVAEVSKRRSQPQDRVEGTALERQARI